jgi:hypothetical protein
LWSTALRRTLRLFVGIAVVGALTSACSGTSKPAQGSPPASRSAAPSVVETLEAAVGGRRGADGSVPKDLAFDAYSQFVGAIPGWTVRQKLPTKGVVSGTFAVLWALKYWDTMPVAQRAAVLGSNVAGTPSPGHTFLRPSALVDPALVRNIENEVTVVEDRIARLIGRHLTIPYHVTVPASHFGPPTEFATTDPEPGPDGHSLGSCLGTFNPDIPTTGPEFTSLISHEVFHCFQFALYPESFVGTTPVPDWIMEGEAAWVGEQIAGGSRLPVYGNWWQAWLANPGEALTDRQYSSIGLLSDVDEVTHSVERLLDPMVADPAGAYARLLAHDGSQIRRDWGTRLVREPSFGESWESVGPGITDDRATPATLSVSTGATAHLGAFPPASQSAAVARVDLAGDAVRIASSTDSATGAIRTSDGSVISLHGPGPVTVCLKSGGCRCPNGSDPFGGAPQGAAGAAFMAMSTDAPNGVTFTSLSLVSECRSSSPAPPSTPAAAGVDRALVGSWQSVRWHFPPVVADTTSGGSGMRMQLHADGSAEMDFAAMRAVTLVKSASGLQSTGTFVYRGSGPARWDAGGGSLRISYTNPHGFRYHFAFSAGGTSVPPVDGDFAQGAAGTSPAGPLTHVDYAAAGSTLVFSMDIPRNLGTITITFEKV